MSAGSVYSQSRWRQRADRPVAASTRIRAQLTGPTSGTVVAAFPAAVYARVCSAAGEGLIAVLADDAPRLPFGLVVPTPGRKVPFAGVAVGDAVRGYDGRLAIGPLHVAAVRWWDPSVVRVVGPAARPDGRAVAAALAAVRAGAAAAAAAGQPDTGPALGQPRSAQPGPEEPVPGRPDPYEPVPGRPEPDEPVPGRPDPYEPVPGRPDPFEPVPGRPEPGQPPPGLPVFRPVLAPLWALPAELAQPAAEFVAALRARPGSWLGDAKLYPAAVALRRMIGLGPGLTPAGDDFLAGALLALHAFAPQSAIAVAESVRAAAVATVTTEVSVALLQAAADGHAPAEVASLLAAVTARPPTHRAGVPGPGVLSPDVLGQRHDPRVAVATLARMGHTSGTALAVGALCVARTLLDVDRPQRHDRSAA